MNDDYVCHLCTVAASPYVKASPKIRTKNILIRSRFPPLSEDPLTTALNSRIHSPILRPILILWLQCSPPVRSSRHQVRFLLMSQHLLPSRRRVRSLVMSRHKSSIIELLQQDAKRDTTLWMRIGATNKVKVNAGSTSLKLPIVAPITKLSKETLVKQKILERTVIRSILCPVMLLWLQFLTQVIWSLFCRIMLLWLQLWSQVQSLSRRLQLLLLRFFAQARTEER